MDFLRHLGCRLLTLSDDAGAGVERVFDSEGIYSAYLTEKMASAMLTRPDTNLFGFAVEMQGVASLVDELRQKLAWRMAAQAA